MKKLNEVIDMGGSVGAMPGSLEEPKSYVEPVEQDKDLTDFYAACGLPGKKVDRIVKQLMGYFENDRKSVIPGIGKMLEEQYVPYFLQYLGEYQNIMKDPKKSDHILKLTYKKDRTPEENKELENWKKENNIK